MQTKWISSRGLATLLCCATVATYAAPTPPPKQRETPAQFLTAAVPDVKGKSYKDAETTLKQAGFTVANAGVVGTANKLNVNLVAVQEPAANTRAPKGSVVKLKTYIFQIRRY